jgi:tRNA uridine 5-carbamoylmethylation protein Kti12
MTNSIESLDCTKLKIDGSNLMQLADGMQWVSRSISDQPKTVTLAGGDPVARVAVILRGIPGSGKSLFAKELSSYIQEKGSTAAVHSTDDYFLNSHGEYQFDEVKLGENHLKNQAAFERSLAGLVGVVICDNTNTTLWEVERYVDIARDHNYSPIVVTVVCNLETALERGTHDVPEHVVRKMHSRIKESPDTEELRRRRPASGGWTV